MNLCFLIVSNNQATSSVSTHVPILDGTNYREWAAQLRAYLWSVGLWLIVSGTTMVLTDLVELQKWTLSDLMANGAIELRCSLNIHDLIGNTSAATWTALSTTFGATGVSRLFGDFKAVTQFRFSGTQHPAAEISRFNTHNQRLVASGVTQKGYILGMLLLGALPSKWDHVAAIYLQGKTAHTDIDYTEVRNAIIADSIGLEQVQVSSNMRTRLLPGREKVTTPHSHSKGATLMLLKLGMTVGRLLTRRSPKSPRGKANRLTLLSMSPLPPPSLSLLRQYAC